MCCAANHDVLLSGLDSFLAGTFHVGVETNTEGEPPLLVGSCPTCAAPLKMPISEHRGHVVHGEIAT